METNRQKEVILNLPNTLSFLRLGAIPLVILCLYIPGRVGSFLASLIFGAAFITDLLDGYYARRYNEVTIFGKFLDPLADKILVCVTLIMLIPMNRVPALMVMLIIAREIAVTGFRGIAVSRGIVIQASNLGKYKTVFQSIATVLLLLYYPYFGIDAHVVGIVLLWIALILTIWSAWAYFKAFGQVFFTEGGE